MRPPGLETPPWAMRKGPKRKRGKGWLGRRVYTLTELDLISHAGGCVVVAMFRKPCPAAWVLSMQARIVHRMFNRGLYLWQMPRKGDRK